jgi:hypothetical protein
LISGKRVRLRVQIREQQHVRNVGSPGARGGRLHEPQIPVPAERFQDAEDQILLGLRLVRRALDEEASESFSESAQQSACLSLIFGEAPIGVRGANAIDEKVLGEELARVHRPLTSED